MASAERAPRGRVVPRVKPGAQDFRRAFLEWMNIPGVREARAAEAEDWEGAEADILAGIVFQQRVWRLIHLVQRIPGFRLLDRGAMAATLADYAVLGAIAAVELPYFARALVQAAELVRRFGAGKVVDSRTGRPIGRPRFVGYLVAFFATIPSRSVIDALGVARAVIRYFTGGRWIVPAAFRLPLTTTPGAYVALLGRVRVL